MKTTIDNITIQRIVLDKNDVKDAIKFYIASTTYPKVKTDAAVVVLNPGGALVEIILDHCPDLPDTAPPCMEIPGNGITSPIHPDKLMEELRQKFSPSELDDET